MNHRILRALRPAALLAAPVALFAPALTAAAQTGAVAFVDVTVIPMDRERTLEHQTVVVIDGRVSALGPAASVLVPRGTTSIDGKGKFLIPGLGDAHLHLSSGGAPPALADRALALTALHGVTMARSMYTEPHHAAARGRVERGEAIGPRLVMVSPALTGQNAATPDAARDAVRRHHADGYRIVKILPGLSRATFDTTVVEAQRLGMRLTGHVPAGVGLDRVLASGFQSIEHLDGFLESLIREGAGVGAAQGGFFGLGVLEAVDESRIATIVAATRAAGVTIVPTELAMETFVSTDSGEMLARRPEMQYAPAPMVEQWTRQKGNFARAVGVTPERASRYRDVRRRLIRELAAAGVPIALGSDAFNLFDVPGVAVFHELETLVAAGLTPFSALGAATVNVSRLMGLEDETGTIAVGKAADLVLLDADPLRDVANVRRQSGVMLRGRWLPRIEIEARLREIAAAP